MVAIVTGRVPRYTPSLHRARTFSRAPSGPSPSFAFTCAQELAVNNTDKVLQDVHSFMYGVVVGEGAQAGRWMCSCTMTCGLGIDSG